MSFCRTHLPYTRKVSPPTPINIPGKTPPRSSFFTRVTKHPKNYFGPLPCHRITQNTLVLLLPFLLLLFLLPITLTTSPLLGLPPSLLPLTHPLLPPPQLLPPPPPHRLPPGVTETLTSLSSHLSKSTNTHSPLQQLWEVLR